MQHILVSLILPAYNDHVRLRTGLVKAVAFLKKQSFTWEIIVIDDGSDKPVQASGLHVSLYRLPKNFGKGAAIALGVAQARGRYIVFSDVDFSVGIETLPHMLLALKNAPVVIASRRKEGATIETHQSPLREFAGRIFTFLSNWICVVHVADATCGFKGFEAHTAKKLFGKSKIHRWVFDTEILFLARRKKHKIIELPVTWRDQKGSKVTFWGMIESIIDLLRIRIYEMRGLYN